MWIIVAELEIQPRQDPHLCPPVLGVVVPTLLVIADSTVTGMAKVVRNVAKCTQLQPTGRAVRQLLGYLGQELVVTSQF